MFVSSLVPAVYNVQIAFANRGLIPNFVNILKGHSLVGDVYIERIPIAKVDTSSDESINQFLMNMYAKKASAPKSHLNDFLTRVSTRL